MRHCVASLCGLWMLMAGVAGSAAEPYPESSVKAAFVLRFAGHVQWPADTASEADFVIAVLGSADMAEQLMSQASGRTLLERRVQVRAVASLEAARGARILYVAPGQRRQVRAGLPALAARGVLVITDEEAGLATGGIINFLLAGDRVRFEVALGRARNAGFRISPELLSMAARVTQ